jgi:hypothetical protein
VRNLIKINFIGSTLKKKRASVQTKMSLFQLAQNMLQTGFISTLL